MNNEIKPETHSFTKPEEINKVNIIKIKGNKYAQKTAFKHNSLLKTTSTSSFKLKDCTVFKTSISLSFDSDTPQADLALQPSQLTFPFKDIIILSSKILDTIPLWL